MISGVGTLSELKSELNVIVNAGYPAEMGPHVSQVVKLLKDAQLELTPDLPGLSVEIVTKYNDLVDVFNKGLTALGSSNPNTAMSELKVLSQHALDQIKRSL